MGNNASFRPKKRTDRITDHWSIGSKLGQGTFGMVRRCTRKDTCTETGLQAGLVAAVKIIDKKGLTDQELNNLDRESDILEKADHPNTVRLYEVYDTKSKLYLVMECCEGKELFDAITEQESPFTEQQAADVVRQVCSALVYLHAQGIVHRDLKPENILYADQAREVIKVMDFGLAKLLDEDDVILKTRCGTLHYVAPEVLSNNAKHGYSNKCDIWSVGVILYVLLCGYLPFFHEDRAYTAKLIRRGKYQYDPEEWAIVSDEAKDLINHMICKNVDQRFSAQDVLDHPWITNNTSSVPVNANTKELASIRSEKFLEYNENRHYQNLATYRAMALTSMQIRRWMREATLNLNGTLSPEELEAQICANAPLVEIFE